jgi:phosphonate transport system substrate-binding protein
MKKMFAVTFCVVTLLSGVLAAPQGAVAQKTDALRMVVTDLEGLEQLQREFGAFRDLLSEKLGMKVEFYPVPNRTAGVEAVRSEKADVILTGPAEYVVFRAMTDARLVAGFSRPDYYCSIVTLADSGINSIKDLKGKKIAIGSVGSTSKHLAPMQIIADNGLDPLKEIEAIHTSVELGWEALKRGDVQAWGMTTDKFIKLRGQEKVLPMGAFKVIARGPDLPNDVLLVASHVDPSLDQKIRTVLTENSDELVATILKGEDNKKYKGMKFLTNVKDSDYNYVRTMYKTIGQTKFSKFPGE